MKQLEPTSPIKRQVSCESVALGFYEASSKTEFEASRINIIGQRFWVQQSHGTHNFFWRILWMKIITDRRISNVDEISRTIM
jgi:hypothetical protein